MRALPSVVKSDSSIVPIAPDSKQHLLKGQSNVLRHTFASREGNGGNMRDSAAAFLQNGFGASCRRTQLPETAPRTQGWVLGFDPVSISPPRLYYRRVGPPRVGVY